MAEKVEALTEKIALRLGALTLERVSAGKALRSAGSLAVLPIGHEVMIPEAIV